MHMGTELVSRLAACRARLSCLGLAGLRTMDRQAKGYAEVDENGSQATRQVGGGKRAKEVILVRDTA